MNKETPDTRIDHLAHAESPFADWPDIHKITFGCLYNKGRSLLAEHVARLAMTDRQIPEFFVSSGSLLPYKGSYPNLHPLIQAELEKRHERPLYPWELIKYSKPLRQTYPDSLTDIILLVPPIVAIQYIPDHLYSTIPRSITCVPFDDPSNAKAASQASETTKLYDRLEKFILVDLKAIITNVRSGYYTNEQHYRKGIFFPNGISEIELSHQLNWLNIGGQF